MKVHLSVDSEDSDPYPLPDFDLVSGVFGDEIEHLWPAEKNKPEAVEVSLTFLSADDMKQQNFEFRDVDAPTDVLSFPLWEEDCVFSPQDFPVLPLGDILVCPEQVAQNAKENNSGYIEELCLVLSHAFLHLLAWDHDTKEKETEMWRVQALIKDRIMEGLV